MSIGIEVVKLSILIVDDELVLRESLRDWLEEAGYKISLAATGEEALKILKRQTFGLVIIDYGLPGMDGISVLKKMNALNLSAKCIIVTANPSAKLSAQAMKLGAVDFLIKPVVLEKLETVIRETLWGCRV